MSGPEWYSIHTVELKVDDNAWIQGNNYTVSNGVGSAGQVLTTNGAGVLSWTTNGQGDVVGPAVAVSDSVAAFSGTSGKLIKDSGVPIASVLRNPVTANVDLAGFAISGCSSVSIGSPTQYVLPTAAGSAGQVLTAGAAPAVSWSTPATSKMTFSPWFAGTSILAIAGWMQLGTAASLSLLGADNGQTRIGVPWNSTLKHITYTAVAGGTTSTFNIRKNGVSLGNFTLPDASGGTIDVNYAFAKNDKVGVFWTGTGLAAQIVFTLLFQET